MEMICPPLSLFIGHIVKLAGIDDVRWVTDMDDIESLPWEWNGEQDYRYGIGFDITALCAFLLFSVLFYKYYCCSAAYLPAIFVVL